MQGQSGLEVLAVPSDEVLVYINPCKSEPPYDDPDVRRAWTMAIDRDALTAVATEGLGEPAPGIWPTGSEFSNPDAQRTYDPDAARELLAGSSPEVVLTFPSALPYLQTTAEIIQQQLNEVGFSATLRPAANTEEIFSPETKMLLILGGFPWSNRVARQLGPDSGTNICTYSDPKFDELNGALKATSPDDPAAKDLWYEMEQPDLRRGTVHPPLLQSEHHRLPLGRRRVGAVPPPRDRLPLRLREVATVHPNCGVGSGANPTPSCRCPLRSLEVSPMTPSNATTDPPPVATPGTTRLGWIGTGIMGSSMCRHLIDKGFTTTIWSRTRSKAEALLAAGATWADGPSSVADASDVVFTMLGYPSDVRQVIAGDSGVLAGGRPGAIVVDMTTSEPSLAVELATTAASRDVHVLDAPVSGGDIGARNGTLSIMVGGDPNALTPCGRASTSSARRSSCKAGQAPVSTPRR